MFASVTPWREPLFSAIRSGLGVGYEHILLLGHSAGTNLAASVEARSSKKVGLLVLVSFQRAQSPAPSAIVGLDFPKTIVFYPEYRNTIRFL
jgi:hypothetical protein